MNTLKPSKVHLHKESKILELVVAGNTYQLSAELLRVHSKSAEVTGHGPGQEVLVDGKIHVGIESMKAVGNYGLQIVFDDEHDSGIYSWGYLTELCHNQEDMWQVYLQRLKDQGKNRDPHTTVIQFSP
jgi:DUF971 family protein